MKKLFLLSISIVLIVLAAPTQSTIAGDKPFPKIVETLAGSFPEGFAIGTGSTAYNSSPLGSIFKVDLRSGQGEVLVPVQNPDPATACVLLGMRVDPRTNYLFAAGCFNGNAFVYDADTGALIMEYQLAPPFTGVVNDLTITKDAVYFTDSFRPVLYRLPLSENGGIPLNPGAATEIPLPAEFELDFLGGEACCGGNGIVATPDGKTLIVGHSNLSRLYRVDPATGDVQVITEGLPIFPDGLAIKGRTIYTLHPLSFLGLPDEIKVIELSADLLSGEIVGTITDPDLDGVASGAVFGSSLYVNKARYNTIPEPDTEYWLTKLRIAPKKR